MTKTNDEIVADLLARRDTILTQLASMGTTGVGALPNTSGTGDHVDHVGLRRSLYEELKEIEGLLQRMEGPSSVFSVGRMT